jgi:lipopolysaccharide biosynthesis glycosyltransferase
MKSQKNAILIISINLDNCPHRQSLTDSCLIHAEKYAKRVGAQIEVITTCKYNLTGKFDYNYINLEKNQIYELYDKYDRILRIDTDVIIRKSCPDLFKLTDPNIIYATREDINCSESQRLSRLRELKNSQFGFKKTINGTTFSCPGLGDINWRDFYVNSGVVLASKCHKEIYHITEKDKNVIRDGGMGFAKEQTLMNWKIQNLGFKIEDLGPNFNHMRFFDWKFPKKNSHIIHMAGNHIADQMALSKVFTEEKKFTLYPNKHLKNHFGHFVHAMEYFYKASGLCIESQGAAKLVNPKHLVFETGDKFVKGFLNAIQDMDGLSFNEDKTYNRKHLIEIQTSPEWCPELIAKDSTSNWFTDSRLAKKIRDHIIPSQPVRSNPRIAILNRLPSAYRSIINAKDIADAINKRFGFEVNIANFDGLDFTEQITFFNSHDIILSPHGAQLCSIPFLPDHGYVVEFSRKEYYRPDYFGELASHSGKNFISACSTHEKNSLNPWKEGLELVSDKDSCHLPSYREGAGARAKCRNQNFDINIEDILGLMKIIHTTRQDHINAGDNDIVVYHNYTIRYNDEFKI